METTRHISYVFFWIHCTLWVHLEFEPDPPLETGVSLLFLTRIRALVSRRWALRSFLSKMCSLLFARSFFVFCFQAAVESLTNWIFSQLFGPRSNVSYERISENKNISVRASIDRSSWVYKLKRGWGSLECCSQTISHISRSPILYNLWRWHSTTPLLKAITTEQHMAHTKRILNLSVTYLNVCSSGSILGCQSTAKWIHFSQLKWLGLVQELTLKSFRSKWNREKMNVYITRMNSSAHGFAVLCEIHQWKTSPGLCWHLTS